MSDLRIVVGDSRERLAEIRAEAIGETYDGNLDFGHVGTGDFIEWVDLIQPQFARIKGYENLRNFDLHSIMILFEEWTQGKLDAELDAARNKSSPEAT